MQGVILKETPLLEVALNNGKVKKEDIPDILVVLTRHYLSLGLNKEEVYHKLNEYYKSTGIGYNETVSYTFINNMINSIYNSGRYNLVDINAISISTNEWDKIVSLNDKNSEKLAFVILVYQKVNELKNPRSNGWINFERTHLLREAGFTQLTKDNKLNFHKLYKCNYLGKKSAVDATGYLVNYRDINNKNSKAKMIITNFTKIITYYDEHKNGVKYKECEVCGRRFKLSKNDYSSKYCSKCKKIVRNDKQKKIMSKKRNKSKMLA